MLTAQAQASFPQPAEQMRFGVFGARLAIDHEHTPLQSRQQAGSHQRRLAAAGRAVNQTDLERAFPIRLFDASFPESNAVGESLSVTWAGQQVQEEFGIMGIEAPQPFGYDWGSLSVGGDARRQRAR